MAITGFDSTGLTPNSGRKDITGHLNDALSYSRQAPDAFRRRDSAGAVDSFYTTGARGAFFFNGAGPW